MKNEAPKTCGEAATWFRRQSEKASFAIDTATLRAQAQVLEMFPADTPVPQKMLDTWDFEK